MHLFLTHICCNWLIDPIYYWKISNFSSGLGRSLQLFVYHCADIVHVSLVATLCISGCDVMFCVNQLFMSFLLLFFFFVHIWFVIHRDWCLLQPTLHNHLSTEKDEGLFFLFSGNFTVLIVPPVCLPTDIDRVSVLWKTPKAACTVFWKGGLVCDWLWGYVKIATLARVRRC